MKGRPITGEEFDRMIASVEKTFYPVAIYSKGKPIPVELDDAEKEKRTGIVTAWQNYLEGLRASGLRLAESLQLHWDRQDRLCVDLEGKRPMLRIPAALEKGNQDRVLPMAPEFAALLLAVPEAERTGRVFKLLDRRGKPAEFKDDWVSRVVSAIGAKSGVKVNVKTVDGQQVVKFASAHDLRRSFGERWAPRVMPQVLKELMRHENIETTLRYYVGRNAQTTADVLWAAHDAASNTSGNSAPISAKGAEERLDVT